MSKRGLTIEELVDVVVIIDDYFVTIDNKTMLVMQIGANFVPDRQDRDKKPRAFTITHLYNPTG
jgi:hypothetical protein